MKYQSLHYFFVILNYKYLVDENKYFYFMNRKIIF